MSPVRKRRSAARRTAGKRRRSSAKAESKVKRKPSRASKAKPKPRAVAKARKTKPAAKARRRGKPRLKAVLGGKAPRGANSRSGRGRRRPAPLPFPPVQAASEKQRRIFEMVRARVAFHSAIQGLEASAAEQPTGPGKWTPRQHALHLAHRDQEVGRVLESALHGIAPSWADYYIEETCRFNAGGIDGLAHLDWDEAKRLLLSARMELMEALESIPDETDETWGTRHPFGAMLGDLADNDRHHAEIVKRWRVTG
jgi:hypothetical protein